MKHNNKNNVITRWLSHRPVLYALITGTGIILFWRGIWHTADMLVNYYASTTSGIGMNWEGVIWWDGPLSIVLGALILLICGAFVSSFIGNEIIIAGIKGEKVLTEKIELELKEIEDLEKREK